MKISGKLYDYLFHYNQFTDMWSAFTRDQMKAYFNGTLEDDVKLLSDKNLENLIKTIESL